MGLYVRHARSPRCSPPSYRFYSWPASCRRALRRSHPGFMKDADPGSCPSLPARAILPQRELCHSSNSHATPPWPRGDTIPGNPQGNHPKGSPQSDRPKDPHGDSQSRPLTDISQGYRPGKPPEYHLRGSLRVIPVGTYVTTDSHCGWSIALLRKWGSTSVMRGYHDAHRHVISVISGLRGFCIGRRLVS